jgi:uncharacterized protein (TIGR02391 family)
MPKNKGQQMDWIKEIDSFNFLGIYDVALDMKQELNISPDGVIIPLLQIRVKFPQLFPVDSIKMRDDYCETRWKAIKFLKSEGIIKDFTLIKAYHRWDQKIRVTVQKDLFDEMLNAMHTDYKRRTQKAESDKPQALTTFWDLLHPKIVEISKSRFDSRHFADSVEAALKEVNSIVKTMVREQISEEFDGADLMNRAFSLQNPVIKLDDLSSETGRNIQKGYMQIFSGTMTGIRNPKAHENVKIDEIRAIHFLFLASLLMYKIDERK